MEVSNLQTTYFKDIYCLNNTIKTDSSFCKMPVYLQYALYWRYLQFAISYFQYDCAKNILDYKAYYEQSYSYLGDGVEKDFLLSPSPQVELPDLYVAIKEKEEEDYTVIDSSLYVYDIPTSILTFNTAPQNESSVKIVAYRDGYFNVELDINEKIILAEGMNIPFLEKNQNNAKLLNQIVYGGNMKIYSQAEHMKQLGNIVGEQRNNVDNLIVNYSFRNRKYGADGLKLGGLVGRSIRNKR